MADAKAARRAGGRSAKQRKRQAPVARSQRPVQPGQLGGRYQPLTNANVERVHETALTVLETVGLANSIPSCAALVQSAGGGISKEGRLLFPRKLVQEALRRANRNTVLHGRVAEHDLQLAGTRLYFGTAGAAVHVAEAGDKEYRESTLADIYDAARLVDVLDNIHFFQRPMVARDMPTDLELDVNTLYACLAGTGKHVGTSFVTDDTLRACLPLVHALAGGEQAWRARPFVSISCCFVVPPLRFAQDACGVLEAGVAAGFPILLLSAGQAGATSPAALAGSVVQEVAEVLAGLTYVNLLRPGHPAIFGTWPFVSDLRTGAMSGGSGEQAVLAAACAQMGRYYDLPTGIAAGMADAKLPDVQSGYEKAYTDALAAHSGANLVYEAAGMQASLLGCSLESLVVDNDMLGAINRTVRGIEVNDSTLSLQTIKDVCVDGPSHYLGDAQTLSMMHSEYLYPEVGDRTSPKEWYEQDKPDVMLKASARLRRIMAEHFPAHIDAAVDARLRAELPIRLPPETMRASTSPWTVNKTVAGPESDVA
ncbi:MAG: methyltransferase [Gammaproteobacteria bacterium]|nr:methyltransferase [Gammaproteobacteria bacterium]